MNPYYVTVDNSEDNMVHGIVEAESAVQAAVAALRSHCDDDFDRTDYTVEDFLDNGGEDVTVRTWFHQVGDPYGFSRQVCRYRGEDLLRDGENAVPIETDTAEV